MGVINTYTLKKFDPCNPDENTICIEDIAHALSMLARSGGHFPCFYSVARHCISCCNEAMARNYPPIVCLFCLLHDGSEAYLQDITSPVKANLPDYLKFEKVLQDKIYLRFAGRLPMEEEQSLIDAVDKAMLYYEFKEIMGVTFDMEKPVISVEIRKEFTSFSEDEQAFLKTYEKVIKYLTL